MKLTIKCSESCPIGDPAQLRRVLGRFNFELKTSSQLFEVYEIAPVAMTLNAGESLILEQAIYTAENGIISLIVAYKTEKESKKIFAGIFEFKNVPGYFAFLLPSGRFVELCIEHAEGSGSPA
jgi:hypothetical protein